jgi:penicillin-insensitive murein endopeptidase
MTASRLALALAALLVGAPLHAQDKGSLEPRTLPPLAKPDDPATPAKELFGRKTTPSRQKPQVVGFYAKGCLAGADMLPIDGDAWQVMRLSRNRNWGHPALTDFLMRTASELRAAQIWPGFLVGDMSQPRGGPMLTGHASHQIGLDADIWQTPMPDRQLTRAEREEMSATQMVRPDRLDIDPARWTPAHMTMLKAVAEKPEVQRIFVNAAIKKALCRDARGDRAWLSKMRPMYGHDYHFHIRLSCPLGEAGCTRQDPVPEGEGCDASLAWWFTDEALHPKVDPNAKPKPPMTMAALPNECRAVLKAQ